MKFTDTAIRDTHAITPIETFWSGIHYRSRVEARWAVFFERMDIEQQYELEGFHLGDGALYLPDFYLPRVSMWAEVKPFEFTPEQLRKCELLVRGTGRGCLLLDGPPDFRAYDGLTLDAGDITRTEYLLDIYAHGRRYYLRERRLFAAPGDLSLSDFSERFGNAVGVARRERFKARGTPQIGREPFNLAPGEMAAEWRI